MDINIECSSATTRVPRRSLLSAHGGNGGMFDVRDMVVTKDTSTGKVLINYANHPKLRIDCRTDAVDLGGKVGSYAGECKPWDVATLTQVF